MELEALIELLLKVKKVAGSHTKVYIRDYENGRMELFGILPEQGNDWEIILVLE